MQPNEQHISETDRLKERIAQLEARLAIVDAHAGDLLPTDILSAIIQASPLPIVALTRYGKITVWNPAAEKVFGWTAAEVMGKPLPFIPEDKMDEHRAMRQQDLAGQGFSGRELRRRRKDGSLIDVSVSTAPIRNAAGQIAGIMSVYVDVTERKAAEEWLQQQAELLEQAHDAIMVWKLGGVIEYWNRAAEQLYGYSKAEAVGQISHVMLQTEVVGGGTLLDALRANRVWSAELLHTTKDGRRIIVETRQAVVRTGAGHEVVLESNRDVTGRVQADRNLRAVNDALRRANVDLEQFAYAAAHDLQEPLRNIAIFAELLTQRYGATLADDGVAFMRTIVEGARRMQALVNDLLKYSSAVDQDRPADAWSDANQVLAQVLADLSRVIAASGAVVNAHELPRLPISATHLSQLFHNLIGNAIKYRQPFLAPQIDIEATVTDTESVIRIRDNGVGIAPEYRDRVFGLFKRLHPSSVPGTGLGLAICRRIVDHYGGRIWVQDGPDNQGVTFCIALPASER